MKVRGGAEISFKWKDNKIQNIHITATTNNQFVIKLPSGKPLIAGTSKYKVEGDKLYLTLNKGNKIEITLNK